MTARLLPTLLTALFAGATVGLIYLVVSKVVAAVAKGLV